MPWSFSSWRRISSCSADSGSFCTAHQAVLMVSLSTRWPRSLHSHWRIWHSFATADANVPARPSVLSVGATRSPTSRRAILDVQSRWCPWMITTLSSASACKDSTCRILSIQLPGPHSLHHHSCFDRFGSTHADSTDISTVMKNDTASKNQNYLDESDNAEDDNSLLNFLLQLFIYKLAGSIPGPMLFGLVIQEYDPST